MYSFETKFFGKIEIDESGEYNQEKYLDNNDKKLGNVDMYIKVIDCAIDDKIIMSLKNVLDSFYVLKEKSEKYLIENYNKNTEIINYFEDFFTEKFGGALLVHLKIKNNKMEELNECMAIPIQEKIKLMPLPNIFVYIYDKNKIETKLIFDSVKEKYSTSLWFHYDKELNLNKFWVDIIDPWK